MNAQKKKLIKDAKAQIPPVSKEISNTVFQCLISEINKPEAYEHLNLSHPNSLSQGQIKSMIKLAMEQLKAVTFSI